jgi:hypothetical protein
MTSVGHEFTGTIGPGRATWEDISPRPSSAEPD